MNLNAPQPMEHTLRSQMGSTRSLLPTRGGKRRKNVLALCQMFERLSAFFFDEMQIGGRINCNGTKLRRKDIEKRPVEELERGNDERMEKAMELVDKAIHRKDSQQVINIASPLLRLIDVTITEIVNQETELCMDRAALLHRLHERQTSITRKLIAALSNEGDVSSVCRSCAVKHVHKRDIHTPATAHHLVERMSTKTSLDHAVEEEEERENGESSAEATMPTGNEDTTNTLPFSSEMTESQRPSQRPTVTTLRQREKMADDSYAASHLISGLASIVELNEAELQRMERERDVLKREIEAIQQSQQKDDKNCGSGKGSVEREEKQSEKKSKATTVVPELTSEKRLQLVDDIERSIFALKTLQETSSFHNEEVEEEVSGDESDGVTGVRHMYREQRVMLQQLHETYKSMRQRYSHLIDDGRDAKQVCLHLLEVVRGQRDQLFGYRNLLRSNDLKWEIDATEMKRDVYLKEQSLAELRKKLAEAQVKAHEAESEKEALQESSKKAHTWYRKELDSYKMEVYRLRKIVEVKRKDAASQTIVSSPPGHSRDTTKSVKTALAELDSSVTLARRASRGMWFDTFGVCMFHVVCLRMFCVCVLSGTFLFSE